LEINLKKLQLLIPWNLGDYNIQTSKFKKKLFYTLFLNQIEHIWLKSKLHICNYEWAVVSFFLLFLHQMDTYSIKNQQTKVHTEIEPSSQETDWRKYHEIPLILPYLEFQKRLVNQKSPSELQQLFEGDIM
jgi:hypothetical protein